MIHKNEGPRSPNPIDVHVGSKLRLQRKLQEISQEKLGKLCGVTFQQVQKYEKGTNRIGASRLWKLAEILGVKVSYFYEGLSVKNDGIHIPSEKEIATTKFIQSTLGVEFAKTIALIDEDMHLPLLELMRKMAHHNKYANV